MRNIQPGKPFHMFDLDAIYLLFRLLQMGLCARVIGVHKLQTLGFYSYLQRYLQPRQKDVTRILLFAAQACHDFIPADIVDRLVSFISVLDWFD